MSIRVMTRVWADSKQSEGSLLVLLSMADHADDGGVCFPSQERLADRARLSVRQVRRVIDRLVAEGELKVIREGVGRGKRTVYKVLTGNSQLKEDNMSAFLENGEKADIGDTKKRTLATPSNIKEPSLEPSVPQTPKGASVEVSNQADRIAAIFKRRKNTPWSEKEVKAWKKLTKKEPLHDDELTMIERYYVEARKKSDNICRRDLLTFLNNFHGEVDRARSWCEKHPLPGSRKIVKKGDAAILEKAMASRPPEDPAETKAFCEKFERQFHRLPAGYKRDGEEIIFVGSGDGQHEK